MYSRSMHIKKRVRNHTNKNQMPEDAEDGLENKRLTIRVHPVLVHTVLQENDTRMY